MTKSLLLSAALAAAPAAAQELAPGELERGVPAVDASEEALGRFLRVSDDGRDLARLVEHLHKRVKGGGPVLGLDQALGAADRRFAAQGGADAVQKALLFNGREARDGLREAYAVLKDYAEKLGKACALERAADARLKSVHARLADAGGRVKQAALEARRYGQGIKDAPPSSKGGDPDAGRLGRLEPQERELAEIKEMLDLGKEALGGLEGKLDGIDALKERVKRHGERAGLLDQGAGAALSVSLTGKGSAAQAGSSREIIADALATLEKAVKLAGRSRTVMLSIVERSAQSAEKAVEADRSLARAKETAARALDGAERAHQEVAGRLRPDWEAAEDSAEKKRLEARAAQLRGETEGAAGEAAVEGAEGASQAAAAKAAGATCACAKNKAAKAVGEPEKLAALEKLGSLALSTPVQDGPARVGGAGDRRVDVQRVRSLLGGASFDGR